MATKKKRQKRKNAKAKRSILPRIAPIGLWIVALSPIVVTAFYILGSVELRTDMEIRIRKAIYTVRDAPHTPEQVSSFLAKLEDYIPNTDGFVVDAEEAGRDGSHFVAGTPRAKTRSMLLDKGRHQVLYGRDNRTLCLAARLLRGSESPYPNLFASNTTWDKLLHELSVKYPERFDEIWLYTGPVYPTSYDRNAKTLPRPKAYYAIAFDITQTGGLRAISFLVPNYAEETKLSSYLTSMGTIEHLTGLRFLPYLQFEAQQGLSHWKSERLW